MGEKSKQGADNMKTLLTFVLLFVSSAVAVLASPGGDYPFRPAELADVAVRPGFWLPRFETNRLVTLRTDFRRSEETGRIHNFEAAGCADGTAAQPCELTLVPYFAWCHRGDGEMQTWFPVK